MKSLLFDIVGRRGGGMAVSVLLAWLLLTSCAGQAHAQAINPQAIKNEFDRIRKEAEVVARVRVLAAVCTEKAEAPGKAVVLQLSLQVLDVEKGPLTKNQVVVLSHKVNLPGGPGPGMYGYTTALRRFPFTPGVKGDVALRWDNEKRAYVPVAGWVAEPNGAAIPKEVGKAYAAGDPVEK